MNVRLCRLTGAFWFWVLPLGAASVPAVSNLGQPFNHEVVVGSNNVDLQAAVSFTTGPSPTDLSGVTLSGFGFGGTSSFRVALYSGVTTAGPSGIVATLSGSASPGQPGNHSYTTPVPLTLAPNTTYWLVASAPSTVNTSGFSWRATSAQGEDSGALGGWSIGDAVWITNNGGASWTREDNRVPQFSVQVNTRPEAAPVITIQPTPVTPFVGANVTLTAGAAGNPLPTYQWRKDGADIAGATATNLTLVAGVATNAGRYSVVATNSAGTATSQDLVVARPGFNTPPASHRVLPGTTVTFAASASSNFPVTYQWQKDGVAIPASAAPTLTVSNVQPFSTGNYALVATNIAGSTTSPAAVLALILSEASRITNLSIRTSAGVGGQPLIVGFVVGGAGTSGTKALLMRGVGPALGAFGVTGFLADPVLSVLSGATVIASNDNWAGNTQVASIGSQVGAFPLSPATSRDAALYDPTLASGAYTIQIAGVGGTSGVTLAEIYDATPASVFFPTSPRLVNVSARTQVGSDAGSLIIGFNISGSTAQTLLIRAIGPTLGSFGVTGALADPRIDLFTGSTLFVSNDNWAGAGAIAAASARVGAFALDAASRDAVLLVPLGPGGYSVQVAGVGNTTGTALIEIYEVP